MPENIDQHETKQGDNDFNEDARSTNSNAGLNSANEGLYFYMVSAWALIGVYNQPNTMLIQVGDYVTNLVLKSKVMTCLQKVPAKKDTDGIAGNLNRLVEVMKNVETRPLSEMVNKQLTELTAKL
ncbi:hypothetical protein BGZ65_007543 [Modicella reniformis]|uniref:Uncharacterized protein n=1 Tax=Modicella reniformis TaxID=1440133 RepID=A0A9P6LU59_9FUNG|nr:hypothetical protein BGZ65_007543 [Modicella reniformis]